MVAIFALALVVAAMVVVAGGSHAQIQIAHLSPSSSLPLSTRPLWRLAFEHSVNQAALEAAITLSPTVPLSLRWNEEELEIRPQYALLPNHAYTLTIGPGVQTMDGVELQGKITLQYQTRPPRIAYLAPTPYGDGQLWISNIEGTNAFAKSSQMESIRDFDVLPTGDSLIVSKNSHDDRQILWWFNVDGGGAHAYATQEGYSFESLQIRPQGDQVAAQIRRENAIGDLGNQWGLPRLYLLDNEQSDTLTLIYGEGPYIATMPRWSPDGSRLAFYDPDLGSIGVTNLETTPEFFIATGALLGEQAWSPDGLFLTYTLPDPLDNSHSENIVVRDVGNGNETILLTPRLAPRSPAFSPDGTQLAFSFDTTEEAERRGGIGLIRPNGTGTRILLTESATTFSQPLWSPDGEWLLFGRFNRAEGQTTQGLWVMRRDGSDLRQIAEVGLRAQWLP